MAAEYQLASDGFDGRAYSGVIRADGRWCACGWGDEWQKGYLPWLEADPKNIPAPFLSPANGGVAIKLQEGEEAVGSMLDSLPPEPDAAPAPQAAPAARPAAATTRSESSRG